MDASVLLEAEIARDPDDVALRLVYADLLIERGDPRGTLIALQHRGLWREQRELLDAHREHFYGALASRPGLLPSEHWELGFLRACRFSLDDDRGPDHTERALAALDGFLAHPSTRLLRELVLGAIGVPRNHYAGAIDVLARHDLRTLERLVFGDIRDSVVASDIGAVAPLCKAVPNLRSLALHLTYMGKDIDLAGIRFPQLRELSIVSAFPLSRDSLGALAAAPWPQLERLELRSATHADELWHTVFTRVPFPRLRHLVLETPAMSGIVRFARNAPIVRQLETLEVRTLIHGDEVRGLLTAADALGHLRRLDLPAAFVPDPAMREALRGLCRDVAMPAWRPR